VRGGPLVWLVAIALAVVVLYALGDATELGDGPGSDPGTATGAAPTTPAIVDLAAWEAADDDAPGWSDELTLLDTIDRRPRETGDGYSREQFGERWADVDGNGCDTRNDALARDLADVTLRRGTCLVQSGTLHDPYSGTTIDFERGPVSSEAVQIDHVVALYDAWRTGAASWSLERRTQLANDPANLAAVDGPTNFAKGHSDAATWLPPNEGYRCEYVAAQVRIKAAYGLWMTPAEHEASRHVLAGCPAP